MEAGGVPILRSMGTHCHDNGRWKLFAMKNPIVFRTGSRTGIALTFIKSLLPPCLWVSFRNSPVHIARCQPPTSVIPLACFTIWGRVIRSPRRESRLLKTSSSPPEFSPFCTTIWLLAPLADNLTDEGCVIVVGRRAKRWQQSMQIATMAGDRPLRQTPMNA